MKFLFVCVTVVFGSVVCAQDPGTETPFPQALTSFTCHGRAPGYYADVETGCRTYHVCDGISHFTYICPRRTLFQQSTRICDHAYRVHCQEDFELPYEGTEGHEEGSFLRLTEESQEGKEFLDEDYVQTEEYFPTETTPTDADKRTEVPTVFLTTSKSILTTTAATPVVTTAATTTTTTTATKSEKARDEATTVNLKEDGAVQKFLKFRLKDFRSLFFIPEFENNSVVTQPEKELILPVGKGDFLTFHSRREGRRSSPPCPAYCNPKFFLPGTCHPCIMIK